jgi:hypothetical protein
MQTSFIDASSIYGATLERSRILRTFVGGKLISDPINGVPVNIDQLPSASPNHTPLNKQRLTGDMRGNVNPGILSLHGLLVLEHNRVADEIHFLHGMYNDEQLYQEARQYVIALMQVITYNEYLPSLIGEQLPPWTQYKSDVNPSIDTFFGVAAYRYGHSGINSIYLRLNSENKPIHEGHLLLRDSYFNPSYLQFGGIESIIRGLIFHLEQQIDTVMVDDLRHFVEGIAQDLAAMDIQRGRDVGLPSYNSARRYYNLPPVTSFSEITNNVQVQNILESLYGSVENIDAWVGGLAETHLSNSHVGPLFTVAIREQFIRSRDGDRYWYENIYKNEQLSILKSTSLSDIIMRNTNIKNLTQSVFYVQRTTSTCVQPEINIYPPPNMFIPIDERYSISWYMVPNYNATNIEPFTINNVTSTRIRIILRVLTEGWVGIGFGTSMINAELLIARVVNGVPEIYQYSTPVHDVPIPINNAKLASPVHLVGGTEINGQFQINMTDFNILLFLFILFLFIFFLLLFFFFFVCRYYHYSI